ncbi:hypothetical protein RHECNPAF_12210061 [Rhizobium etli CNPAF512]|nr:hypothetical protein RHECNPAF_12210061 [Rhizobium etli CNPAF512]
MNVGSGFRMAQFEKSSIYQNIPIPPRNLFFASRALQKDGRRQNPYRHRAKKRAQTSVGPYYLFPHCGGKRLSIRSWTFSQPTIIAASEMAFSRSAAFVIYPSSSTTGPSILISTALLSMSGSAASAAWIVAMVAAEL